jgi:hypothetical protein
MPSVEISIKGRDLISAKGILNLIAAGAHRSSALHGYGASFSVVSLPTEPVECEELTKGVFYRRGALE